MTVHKDTIFERFLAPVFKTFLIDQEGLRRFYESIDWQDASDRLTDPELTYPEYYSRQNFHGIEGGYLTKGAAVSYDPVTQYVLPPGEALVRQSFVDSIQSKPQRILDLGCGTGSTTLLLKRKFPDVEVVGLDLSPHMLTVAEHKAKQAGLDIQWRHGNAEKTDWPDGSFDLVTASLLFHETPTEVSQTILHECFRLLKAGGETAVFDGNQKVLRQTEWLTQIFEEPYIQAYAGGSVDAWMGTAQFEGVFTQELWWLNQITHGLKPMPYKSTEPVLMTEWVGALA